MNHDRRLRGADALQRLQRLEVRTRRKGFDSRVLFVQFCHHGVVQRGVCLRVMAGISTEIVPVFAGRGEVCPAGCRGQGDLEVRDVGANVGELRRDLGLNFAGCPSAPFTQGSAWVT